MVQIIEFKLALITNHNKPLPSTQITLSQIVTLIKKLTNF